MPGPHRDDAHAPEDPDTMRSAVAAYAPRWLLALIGLAVAAFVVAMFTMRSPMWLDEALSVNISKLPLGDIHRALRHDGHPPLYYWLLHAWMLAVGDSDAAVRSLSGVFALATLPPAWFVARRLGPSRLAVSLLVVISLSPFVLRYGSETRMYSLVIAEVFLGVVVVHRALERPSVSRLLPVVAVTAAMLWTHYWLMWLLGAVIVAIGIPALAATASPRLPGRVGRGLRRFSALPTDRKAAWSVLGAIALGGLTFVPWLPTLLYQADHTGTPWAPPFRPTTLVYVSLVHFAGGPFSEAQLLMLLLVVLALLGITGRAIDARHIEVDLASRPDSREPLAVLGLTAAIASAAGLVTGMAFAPRYAAVLFPFFGLLVAFGLLRFSDGRARNVVLVSFVALSLLGGYFVVRTQRSESRAVTHWIETNAQGAFVVACPDQLGPSMRRELPTEYEVVSYPRLDDPRFVDWVDYKARNALNDPSAVADRVLELAGPRTVVVAYRDDFQTLEGQCSRLLAHLTASRPDQRVYTSVGTDEFYEPISAVSFRPSDP